MSEQDNEKGATMKLTEALEAQTKRVQGPPCAILVALTELDADDATALTTALASEMQTTMISRALGSVGYPVASNTVGRHRRGDCSCGR